jgi:hypothetical protein
MENLEAKMWKPFDPNENYQIEMAYLSQGRKGKMQTAVTGDVNRVKNGFAYEIDFDKMTELNTHYRATLRPIKREPIKQTRNFSWEMESPKGEWIKFGTVENQQIELAFFARKFPFMVLNWQNTQLTLDFQQMREKKSNFKLTRSDVLYERQLQSRHQKATAQRTEKNNVEVKQPHNDEEYKVKCCLLGLSQDIPNGEQYIHNKIKEMTTTDTVSFEHSVPAVIAKELSAIKKKYSVTLQTEKSKITITGLSMQVVQAKTAIFEIERTSSAIFKAPPPYWDSQKEDLELRDIGSGAEEWTKIEKRFAETIATVKIIQIQRVQNMSQWEKYCFLKDRIARKGSNAPESFLFHGTRGNSPTLIYTGDDGFDMRYCTNGLWGRASYFAHNASYSHNYSYQLSNGHRQMFYARVAVGKSQYTGPDNTIIKPADGCDSVSGETGSSKVYMVYENGRAYPEYLVTYTA